MDAAARALLGFVDCVRTMRFAGGLCGLIVTLPTMAFALYRSEHATDVVDKRQQRGTCPQHIHGRELIHCLNRYGAACIVFYLLGVFFAIFSHL
ncbi:hypothetical protein HPB48_010055 [Haemaphysalis longicornis]|uniref:Uncharacterized protein n=1 Tax=Haemaphysalis longicornis TaxID=44386 RepID=A0A9J6F6U9_HAELO|nr:hypothetical protein HPB48_010055 [Haemaphysalis longicornis]